MDAVDAIELSQSEFERRLRAVHDDQWDLPTPCDQWTVRDLVNHVVGAARSYLALLDGCSREEASAILDGNELSDDPVSDFVRAAAPLPAAFRRPEVLEHIYPHPFQDVSGALLAEWRCADNTLHTWDLARAIGADEELNEDLVDVVWAHVEPLAAVYAQTGLFGQGPSGRMDSSQRKQLQLLDALGRRPR